MDYQEENPLVKFFFAAISDSGLRNRIRAFVRLIDDPFFSMLYITPKGDEKTLARDFVA
jgi:hypothetical protein